ncbi:response regulator [Kineococcus sp. SYSU DK001]|uniref:response regulator n=1 Tax=Kineococcus sp. SYSU DK001 TaxID=3383122 RepID=UPI003D7DB4FB
MPDDALRVLVVDDDPMVASVHGGFVDAAPGCRLVGTAGTGTRALDLVRRLHPDVVLLDLYLPDVPGLEVLRRLREDGPDVDVVVITAAREADTVRTALRSGVAGYLIKPFGAQQLTERLQHVRAARRTLTTGVLRQADVDRALGVPTPAEPAGRPLPKGLSVETATLVTRALADAGTALSASEVAARLGLSRVAVRRYLEHFVDQGGARVRLRYGAGRPERLYEPVR